MSNTSGEYIRNPLTGDVHDLLQYMQKLEQRCIKLEAAYDLMCVAAEVFSEHTQDKEAEKYYDRALKIYTGLIKDGLTSK